MRARFIITVVLTFGFNSWSSGGMIGGGEVSFRPLMSCSTESIDPTHPGSTTLIVAKEIHYDGRDIEDAPLRIVTMDRDRNPSRFYVTEQTALTRTPDGEISIPIWRYPAGSDGNAVVGEFVWSDSLGEGALKSLSYGEVEELVVLNCVLE